MFRTGETISYPLHGVGVIERVETENGKLYYVILIPKESVHIRIPEERAESMGVRVLWKGEELKVLLQEAGERDLSCPESWNLRCRENLERLKTGRPDHAAEVVKLLTKRAEQKNLSVAEHRLLSMARQVILGEMRFVYKINGKKAEELLAKWMKIG